MMNIVKQTTSLIRPECGKYVKIVWGKKAKSWNRYRVVFNTTIVEPQLSKPLGTRGGP